MPTPAHSRWNLSPPGAPMAWMCNIVWGGNRLALETFAMPGLDGYLLSVPCAERAAGGDIYHVTVCDHGVFSKFLLLDVAGHDDRATRISSRLQQPLAELMTELDNSAILARLNSDILQSEASGSFATAVAATYNDWDRSWSYAYAGHPYMLLRRNGRWQTLPECSAGPPVGVLGEARYFQNELRLNGEDWLLLFSDAVFEIRQRDRTRLGFDGLLRLLDTIDADRIDLFYQALIDALVAVNGSDRFDDDLTLILLRHSADRQSLPARARAMLRRMTMRWMKRNSPRCPTRLNDLPEATKV